jgi:hypothetical protein
MVLKKQHEGLQMMDCFNSMAPSDEELLQLALDEVPLRVGAQEHLKHCSICQQRLALYQHTNGYLLTKLYRSQCPTPTLLNLYCADLLPADKATAITYHIAECPLCTREIIDIRAVFADFEPFPLVEDASIQSSLKRIIATLVPWQPQLVTRGEASAAHWPRQYSAGAINVSLHLSRGSSGENILLGLFTSENPDETIEKLEGVPVDLYYTPGPLQNGTRETEPRENPVLSTQIDDLGNIVFKAVPVGEYVMIVRLPESELVIGGLLIEH